MTTSDIVCSSTMRDPWLHEIGPKLFASDIINLSMTNHSLHTIAHSITQHLGHGEINKIALCHEAKLHWPNLNLKLKLKGWRDEEEQGLLEANSINGKILCAVQAVEFTWSRVANFNFVDPDALRELGFFDCVLIDGHIATSLQQLLTSCSALVALDIPNCIVRSDIRWLETSLTHLISLQHLNLNNNPLGSVLFDVISGSLSHMPHLTSLHLDGVLLRAEGARILSKVLPHTPVLKSLHLALNYFGEDGAAHLGSALQHTRHVTSLGLYGNKITEAGLGHVMCALTHMLALTHLDLRYNLLPQHTAKQLTQLLSWVSDVRLD
eukprot:c11169_g2_i1.p1 GENE.c11169_g2_i1~~c11169_g2_i1.p1  ORF type:complete len:323 (-),score=64.81 c11169_g2_i1:132-1100(-)